MTTATRTLARASGPDESAGLTPRRRVIAAVMLVVALVVIWEGVKWLGGDPWRIHGPVLGLQIDYEHTPPFSWRIADDLSLPHIWSIVAAFVEPAQRDGPPLFLILAGKALFTFRESVTGFVLGGFLGLGLGILFVHSRLAERALVPYVVASQTVPILAISPIIVVAIKADWLSVALVSAYLTFFPVTIASLRGLRAADPRALELYRSYAASRSEILWKLRLPTSVPYLFSSLRVAAAAAVIGAIIGEIPAGVADGLGSAIVNYNQYYVTAPARLWVTIIMCTFVGLAFVGIVRVAETFVTRGRYRTMDAG
jgi:NitT/TauT family transport system permease protein